MSLRTHSEASELSDCSGTEPAGTGGTVPALSTLAVRGGLSPDPASGAIVPPIVQSTTYVQDAVGLDRGHTYSRASNPTVSALEAALGALEGALPAACFASGLAATHALFLATLKSGDHVVVSDVVYGGTYRLLEEVLMNFSVGASFVDTSRPEEIARALRPTTKLVFVETPGNPTLKLSDIRAAAAISHAQRALLIVDNTFLTPCGQRPLDLGADACVYSTTKHIEGHNGAIGGAVTTRDAALLERLRFIRKTVGSIQAPFDAWVTLRGVKTLPIRLRQHSENALAVARWLERHPLVERVEYPGLETCPQRGFAKKQHLRDGGIIAFEVRGGECAGRAVMNSVRLCSLAESLGAVETLITHPATMTHGSIPAAQRRAVGISDGLVRLSVGLEDPKDIIADLAQALDKASDSTCHDHRVPPHSRAERQSASNTRAELLDTTLPEKPVKSWHDGRSVAPVLAGAKGGAR